MGGKQEVAGGQPCVQHAGACCLNEEDSQIAKRPLALGSFLEKFKTAPFCKIW
jgi:hypothetical protein